MSNLFKRKPKGDAIDKFREEKDSLITFEDLAKIPLNEMQQIVKDRPGAIECIRLKSGTESLMFTVYMKQGEVWEKHHHDCDEVCVVFKGELKDTIQNKTAKSAQALEFKAGQRHYVVAKKASVFYVEFKKPKQQ